jgi:hypothetical protein
MYCETRMCKKYSVHFETPAFKYGVPYTPHPIPYTLFISPFAQRPQGLGLTTQILHEFLSPQKA